MILLKKLLSRENRKKESISNSQFRELMEQNQKIYQQNCEQTRKITDIESKVDYLYGKQEQEALQEEKLNNTIATTAFKFLLLSIEIIIIIPISTCVCFFEFLNSGNSNLLFLRIIMKIVAIGVIVIGLDALVIVIRTFGCLAYDCFIETRNNCKKKIYKKSSVQNLKAQSWGKKHIWKKIANVGFWIHFTLVIAVEIYLIVCSFVTNDSRYLSHWLFGVIGYIVIMACIEYADIIRKGNHTILYNGIALIIAIGAYLTNQKIWDVVAKYLSNLIK